MPYPVNATHRLLLEDGTSYLLLEDGTSKLVLNETVALDDPLNAATGKSTTLALSFVGMDSNDLFVQKIGDSTTGAVTRYTVAPLGNTTYGNTLVMGFTAGSGAVVSSITDTQNNVWTIDTSTAASARTACILSAVMLWPLSTKDTITINVSASAACQSVINEYSGTVVYRPLDKANNAQGAAVTTLATGSTGVLTQPWALIFTVVGTAGSAGGFTAPGGIFTERLPTGGSGQIDIADAFITSGASQSATWSWVSAFDAGAAIAAYDTYSGVQYEVEVDTVNTFDSS